ncbi:MAG: transcription elongation factor GreA [Chloroflexota bacterium]
MTDPTAAPLFRSVGLMPDGPVRWGAAVRAGKPGVFVAELGAPVAQAPLDVAKIGKWIERVTTLTLDGRRPTGRELAARMASFWLPDQTVLYIGSTTGSVGGRVAAIVRTGLGERRPAPSAQWLQALSDPSTIRIWWAETDAVEEYEDALLDAFAAGLSDAERAALPEAALALPWANLRRGAGDRKATGIANALLPDVAGPADPQISHVVDLPPAEADGARDEAARRARPARGRGTSRVASAAGYAAKGSPRRAAPEPGYISPDGLDRLQTELRSLLEQRPGVIARIASARELGDLKENAEYHAAREEQGFLEARIRTLEQRLKTAVVVAPEERGATIGLGSRARVEVDGDETVVEVVGAMDANPAAGRVSTASPVGKALVGRRVGDVVTIKVPAGDIRYRIIAIE